jgi:Tfp pilus assembly protein PilN
VKRIDYLRAPARRRVPALFVDQRLRHALAAFGIAVLLVFSTSAVELARLNAAQQDAASLTQRLADAETTAAGAKSLRREIEKLQVLARRVDATRHLAEADVEEIAELGNRLPPDVWLTTLRLASGAVALEGRGARLEEVAAAMTALARLPRFTQARLLHVRDDVLHGGFDYAIAVERAP